MNCVYFMPPPIGGGRELRAEQGRRKGAVWDVGDVRLFPLDVR